MTYFTCSSIFNFKKFCTEILLLLFCDVTNSFNLLSTFFSSAYYVL